jgi:hypothetical protein
VIESLAEALARRRVALGFVSGALVLLLARPTRSTLIAGGAVALAGECLRIWAAGHLNKAREVTSSGPYRFLAHPLYVGSSIMGVGLAIISNHLLVTTLIAVYLIATLTAAVRSEEAFLRRTFGDRYEKYRHGVPLGGNPALVAGNGAVEGRRRFSVAQAIANREQRAIAGLGLALLLLVLKATYNGTLWRAAAGQ